MNPLGSMNRRIKCLRTTYLGACLGAVFLLLPSNTPSLIQQQVSKPIEPKLISAKVIFQTADDDKERDTAVSLYIRLNDGTLVASLENNRDYFRNGLVSTQKLRVVKSVLKGSIQGCISTVKTTRLKGHDSWRFAYEIEFAFSQGPPVRKSCPAVTITENGVKVCPL